MPFGRSAPRLRSTCRHRGPDPQRPRAHRWRQVAAARPGETLPFVILSRDLSLPSSRATQANDLLSCDHAPPLGSSDAITGIRRSLSTTTQFVLATTLITPDIVLLANSFAAQPLYILDKRQCWLEGVSQASVLLRNPRPCFVSTPIPCSSFAIAAMRNSSPLFSSTCMIASHLQHLPTMIWQRPFIHSHHLQLQRD